MGDGRVFVDCRMARGPGIPEGGPGNPRGEGGWREEKVAYRSGWRWISPGRSLSQANVGRHRSLTQRPSLKKKRKQVSTLERAVGGKESRMSRETGNSKGAKEWKKMGWNDATPQKDTSANAFAPFAPRTQGILLLLALVD